MNKEATRVKSYEGDFSKGKLEIQCKPIFKKRVSNQVPSRFPKSRDNRVSNPKYEREESNLCKVLQETYGK